MRRLQAKICLVFSVIFMLTLLPHVAFSALEKSGEYITDGSFETALSMRWTVTGAGSATRCQDCKNSGTYGLRIQDAVFERRIYLYPEETYTFSFYYKMEAESTLSVSAKFYDAGNAETVLSDIVKTYTGASDGWQKETITLCPKKEEDAVVLSFAATDEAVLDDVSLIGTKIKTGNLVQNGDGETVKSTADMRPSGWSAPAYGSLTASKEEVYQGSYAIKLDNKNSGATRIATSQTVYICPETEYLFSLYVRTPGAAYSEVEIAFYDAERKSTGTAVKMNLAGQGLTDWKRRERSFTTPQDAQVAKISVFVGGSGAVLFDDISLLGDIPSFGIGRDAVYSDDIKSPYKETGELLTNTGFEAASDNWPTSSYITLSDEKVYKGTKSLRLCDEKGTANPLTSQEIYNIAPDAEYQFRAWIYADCDLGSADGVGIKVEFYAADGKQEGQFSARRDVNTQGAWQETVYRFYTPASCAKIRLYLRMYGIGTAYMDEVSLLQTGGVRRPFTFLTDSAVYYPDDTYGKATVKLNERALALENITFAANTPAHFSVQDGETVLYEADVPLSEGYAAFPFEIGLLKEKKKPYSIVASFSDTNKNTYTASLTVHVYDRPGAIPKDGIYRENGEPFVPVIAYHIGNAAENNAKYLPFCVAAGINVVQTQLTTSPQDLKNQLDVIASYGLKALVTVYPNMKPAAHSDNIEVVRALVEVAKNHVATFAYALIDEPSGAIPSENGERDRLLRQSHALVHEGDAHHPTFLTDMSFMEDIARYPDVFTIDAYSTAEYGENTKKVIAATDGKKPIYVLLPTYQKNLPSIAEIRFAAYDALMAGAKGIGFYAIVGEGGNPDLPKRPLGEDLIAWNLSGEREIMIAHYVHGKYKTAAKGETDTLRWETFWDKDTLYAVVSNKTEGSVAADVPLMLDGAPAFDTEFPLTDMSGALGGTVSESVLRGELSGRSAYVFEIPKGEKSNTVFTDAEGKPVRRLIPGQTITVQYKHIAKTEKEEISFSIALYQKENGKEKLLTLLMEETAATCGTPLDIIREITVPPLGTGTYAIKVFAWEKGAGAKPLGKAYVLQ